MPALTPRQEQISAKAREIIVQKPVYIDTETTGLTRSDEIIEFSIVDHDGTDLYTTLVKPTQAIPREATRIHGITDRMVETAQAWPIQWPHIRAILFDRLVAAYNVEFDARMMEQSYQKYNLPRRERLEFIDVLKLFADFRGEYDSFLGAYRYFKLSEAGRYFNISLPNAHRSTADALLTRAVLHSIAGLSY
jgi:DNA polymerase III alpha subunit (gram-positive type)